MVLHEIGYLIVGSVFQCWLAGNVMTCPVAGKVKPANVPVEKIQDYESIEVHYEVDGIAVFDKKDDLYEIRKKTGQKIQVSLSELKGLTEKDKSKATPDEAVVEGWHYESLEEVLKNAMLSHEMDFLSLLKKDDLKTSMVIGKDVLESVKLNRVAAFLKGNNISLPIAYYEIVTPCTYKKISATQTTGTCAPAGKAAAYKDHDIKSEKILDASFTWAHLEGRPKQVGTVENPENKEELLVFEESGDWVRMKLSVLDESKRVVWIQKKDIPYKMVKISGPDRMKTLIEFLNPPNASSSSKHINLAENLRSVMNSPLYLDLDSAGETKWSDGTLWLKVNVRSEPHCAIEEAKSISTGWLPYIDPKSKKKVIGWFSRGC